MLSKKKALLDYLKSSVLKTPSIIRAFEKVPREKFVLPEYRKWAYVDEPLPILAGQTISQPYTVAVMTEALEPQPGQRILEVGAGSGYQAALLSEIVGPKGKVFTIERIPELYEFAKRNLTKYKNVKVILGDGSKGLPEEPPFDRIIITAAAPKIPEKLFGQLKEAGIMVVPVGSSWAGQKMLVVQKVRGKKQIKNLGYFVFVPLIEE